MGKKSLHGASGRGDLLNFDPSVLKIITDKSNPKYDPRVEREVDEALVLSIMRLGVIEPLVIERDGDDVIVVAGRQRRAAALEANRRLQKTGAPPVLVPCTWRRGDDGKMFEVAVSENELRTGDSSLERARKMQRLAEFGRDVEQIAIVFGCTPATVRNHLALLECAAPVQRAVESGQIPATIATKMAKLDKATQVTTLDKMIEAGATKGERAHKAVKKKGDVEPKQKALSNKVRERVRDAIRSVAYTEKDETVILAGAVLDFVAGDTAAFKRWPHLEGLVVSALMPQVKAKKEKPAKDEKKRKRAEANGAQTQAAVRRRMIGVGQ